MELIIKKEKNEIYRTYKVINKQKIVTVQQRHTYNYTTLSRAKNI